MRILSNEDVELLLTMPECIDVMATMYADYANGQALLVPRIDNLSPSTEPDAYYAFKQMGGAWPRRRVQALRINSDIVTHPLVGGKMRRVKQPKANGRWVGLVMIFSSETGALIGIFPDGVMQRMRVGAANGIALKLLARDDARTLAIIGSGWQAGGQLMAALVARPFERVRIFSPNAEHRNAFAAEAQARHPGVAIRAVDNAEECVTGADVIMAATSSVERVLDPAWLKPGMHLSCIKSQEVDQTLLDGCDRIVVHVAAQAKQYDNVMAGTPNVTAEHKTGWWNAPGNRFDEYPDLAQLVAGKTPGHGKRGEISCFINNVGAGLQFAAVGALILDKAAAAGLGHELPDEWFSETVHP
ncbi:L-lysine cyclodeaminase [mine drainage metagenome]|uniref:L-lysine cyclodeaminase n=1 Tax=mine drainage metagenome TaxID=410659 RepID=A0A1J5RSV7_9ZZZZ